MTANDTPESDNFAACLALLGKPPYFFLGYLHELRDGLDGHSLRKANLHHGFSFAFRAYFDARLARLLPHFALANVL